MTRNLSDLSGAFELEVGPPVAVGDVIEVFTTHPSRFTDGRRGACGTIVCVERLDDDVVPVVLLEIDYRPRTLYRCSYETLRGVSGWIWTNRLNWFPAASEMPAAMLEAKLFAAFALERRKSAGRDRWLAGNGRGNPFRLDPRAATATMMDIRGGR